LLDCSGVFRGRKPVQGGCNDALVTRDTIVGSGRCLQLVQTVGRLRLASVVKQSLTRRPLSGTPSGNSNGCVGSVAAGPLSGQGIVQILY
jgi:hypothetical protein